MLRLLWGRCVMRVPFAAQPLVHVAGRAALEEEEGLDYSANLGPLVKKLL